MLDYLMLPFWPIIFIYLLILITIFRKTYSPIIQKMMLHGALLIDEDGR